LVFRIEGFYFIHKFAYHDQEFTLCEEMCQVSQLVALLAAGLWQQRLTVQWARRAAWSA